MARQYYYVSSNGLDFIIVVHKLPNNSVHIYVGNPQVYARYCVHLEITNGLALYSFITHDTRCAVNKSLPQGKDS